MRTIPKDSPKDSGSALRALGLRLTGPRRLILEALRGTESHPTAEEVHRLVDWAHDGPAAARVTGVTVCAERPEGLGTFVIK